jgi:hypothetical protein
MEPTGPTLVEEPGILTEDSLMLRTALSLGVGVVVALGAALAGTHAYFAWEYGTRSPCAAAAHEVLGAGHFQLPPEDGEESELVSVARRVFDDGGDFNCYRVALFGVAPGVEDVAGAAGQLPADDPPTSAIPSEAVPAPQPPHV